MTSVLFRVDAGPVVGLGHLQRCLSLAGTLGRHGARSVFLTNQELAAQERVTRFGYEVHALHQTRSWDAGDLAQTIALARAEQCQAVVVDSDHEGADYLEQLRSAGLWVGAIDDLASHPFPCQLVVNGDANAAALPYVSSAGDTVWLLGPDYAMLREEFWSVPQRVVREAPQNLLVMLGGDDPHHLMPEILQMLDTVPGSCAITAVIGPFFTRIEEVESVAARPAHPIRVVRDPDSVCSVMMEADLAISAGGQTLYELARVGCPGVAIETAANQAGQMRALHDAGIIRAIGRAEHLQIIEQVAGAARELLPDAPRRQQMSRAGQQLIDGQGALRVARALLERSRQAAVQGVSL